METLQERDKKLEKLWGQFGEIPMDPETECMEEAFLHFPAGTFREDIWHWFDERYGRGVYHLLYPTASAKQKIADGIALTSRELRLAYEKQQHIYDIQDIENELDCSSDEYDEKYGIGGTPITEKELDDMATALRRRLDENADAVWSICRAEAVAEVLDRRKEDEQDADKTR